VQHSANPCFLRWSQSFAVLIAGFLHATGNPRPEHAQVKSAAALSQFLNQYGWNTRHLIRLVRAFILERL
jgi:hypothetical protein